MGATNKPRQTIHMLAFVHHFKPSSDSLLCCTLAPMYESGIYKMDNTAATAPSFHVIFRYNINMIYSCAAGFTKELAFYKNEMKRTWQDRGLGSALEARSSWCCEKRSLYFKIRHSF